MVFNLIDRQCAFTVMESTLYKCPPANFYFSTSLQFVDHFYSSSSQKVIDFRIFCSLSSAEKLSEEGVKGVIA